VIALPLGRKQDTGLQTDFDGPHHPKPAQRRDRAPNSKGVLHIATFYLPPWAGGPAFARGPKTAHPISRSNSPSAFADASSFAKAAARRVLLRQGCGETSRRDRRHEPERSASAKAGAGQAGERPSCWTTVTGAVLIKRCPRRVKRPVGARYTCSPAVRPGCAWTACWESSESPAILRRDA